MQFESDNESTDSASHGNLAEFKLEHFLLGKTMFESCFIMIYNLTSLEIPITNVSNLHRTDNEFTLYRNQISLTNNNLQFFKNSILNE